MTTLNNMLFQQVLDDVYDDIPSNVVRDTLGSDITGRIDPFDMRGIAAQEQLVITSGFIKRLGYDTEGNGYEVIRSQLVGSCQDAYRIPRTEAEALMDKFETSLEAALDRHIGPIQDLTPSREAPAL